MNGEEFSDLPAGGEVKVASLISSLFFFSSRRRHTRLQGDWSSDVCSSDLSSELAQYLGLNIANVGGRLVRSSPEDLQISVFTVAARDGQETFWKGEMVTLPRRLISSIQERKFSTSRSGFVATLGLVAGVGLLRAFGVLSAGSTSGGGGGVVTK